MNDQIMECHEQLKDKNGLLELLNLLRADLINNREGWENDRVDTYLYAVSSSTEDSDGYYNNLGKPIPQNCEWKLLAEIFWEAQFASLDTYLRETGDKELDANDSSHT